MAFVRRVIKRLTYLLTYIAIRNKSILHTNKNPPFRSLNNSKKHSSKHLEIGLWIAFLSVNKTWKLQWQYTHTSHRRRSIISCIRSTLSHTCGWDVGSS